MHISDGDKFIDTLNGISEHFKFHSRHVCSVPLFSPTMICGLNSTVNWNLSSCLTIDFLRELKLSI